MENYFLNGEVMLVRAKHKSLDKESIIICAFRKVEDDRLELRPLAIMPENKNDLLEYNFVLKASDVLAIQAPSTKIEFTATDEIAPNSKEIN